MIVVARNGGMALIVLQSPHRTVRFDIGFISYPTQYTPKTNPIEVRVCPGLHGNQILENCSLVSIISAGGGCGLGLCIAIQ